MLLRDKFWLWGHPTNSLLHEFGFEEETKMSPSEGLSYLGAKNLYWVPMCREIDKDKESFIAKDLPKVCWSIEKAATYPENVTEIVELSKKYENICGGIFDDFFNSENKDNNYLLYTPELLAKYREELHEAGLEMWIVLYTKIFDKELDMDTIRKFTKEFDGVSLWFWNEDEVASSYERCIDILMDLSKDKKRMVGCYLYDFGDCKKASAKMVLEQLEKGRKLLETKQIEGIILHTNAIITPESCEAVEACREWLQKYGDDEIAEYDK